MMRSFLFGLMLLLLESATPAFAANMTIPQYPTDTSPSSTDLLLSWVGGPGCVSNCTHNLPLSNLNTYLDNYFLSNEIPDRTVTSGATTIGSADAAGQVNISGASTGVTNPGAGSAPYLAGGSVLLNDIGISSVAIANSGTVNGCGATIYAGGFYSYTSNVGGTALDCFGFPGWGALLNQANNFAAAQTFGEVHPNVHAVTLSSNNYAATIADCGTTLLLPTGTAPTLTLPNIAPASGGCIISGVETTSAQYTPQAASGGTLTANVNGFTKTKGTGAFVSFVLTTPSNSAAVWMWSGDGA